MVGGLCFDEMYLEFARMKLGLDMCLYSFLFSGLLTLLFNKEGAAVILPGLSNRNFIKAFLEYPSSQAPRPRGLQAVSSFRHS
jgi:hypothetical protein